MQFLDRSAVIQDDDEWLNIPPVLRKVLRGLNEEAEHNRALTEALRQEQRDTNLLLRRLIQKQTDMELDLARSNLLLATKPARLPEADEGEPQSTTNVNREVKKKLDKTADKLRSLESKFKELSETRTDAAPPAATKQDILDVATRVNNLERDLGQRIEQLSQSTNVKTADLDKSIKSVETSLSVQKDRCDQQSELVKQVLDNVKAMEETCVLTKTAVSDMGTVLCTRGESLEKKHLLYDRRFGALQRALEGIHGYLEDEKITTASALKETIQECQKSLEDGLARQQEQAQKLFLECREQVTEVERRCERDRREMEEGLHSVSMKQLETVHKMEQTLLPDVTDLARKQERIAGKVNLLEDEIGDIKEIYATRGTVTERVAEIVAKEKQANNEALAAVQAQMQRLESLVENVKMTDAKSHDDFRRQLEALRATVQEHAPAQQRSEDKVSKLCTLLHDMSGSLGALEGRLERAETDFAKEAASNKMLRQTFELVQPVEPLRQAVENATRMFRDESVAMRETQRALTDQQDAAALRLSQMERKLADVSLSVDYVKQQPPPTASLPSWAEESLRELSPALVELEAIKRRVAAVEARKDEARINSHGETQRREELQLQTADAVEDTRRRLLELSRRVLAQEQLVSSLARGKASARLVGAEATEDEEGGTPAAVVMRLTKDVTSLLEKLFQTEQSLAASREETREALDGVTLRLKEAQEEAKHTNERVAAYEARVHADLEKVQRLCETSLAETNSRLQEDLDGVRQGLKTDLTRAMEVRMQEALAETAKLNRTVSEQDAAQESQYRECTAAVAGLADSVQRMQSESDGYTTNMRQLESRVSSLEDGLATALSKASAPPPSPPSAPAPEKEGDSLRPMVEALRTQLHEQADVLQSKATILQGLVEVTVPRIRDELDRRVSDLEQATESAQMASTSFTDGASKQLSDLASRATVLDGRVRLLEEASQLQMAPVSEDAAATAALHERMDKVSEEMQQHQQRLETELNLLAQRLTTLTESCGAAGKTTGDPSLDAAAAAAAPAEVTAADLTALEQDLKQYAYPRAELEERLENLWMSFVSLLARKEDAAAVQAKLEELRFFVEKETQRKLEHLHADLKTALADKVSLQEVQSILERHATGSDTTDDNDAR